MSKYSLPFKVSALIGVAAIVLVPGWGGFSVALSLGILAGNLTHVVEQRVLNRRPPRRHDWLLLTINLTCVVASVGALSIDGAWQMWTQLLVAVVLVLSQRLNGGRSP